MKVLHVAAEIFPLVKTGGLADVLGALPQALMGQGADVRLLRGVLADTQRMARLAHATPADREIG